ncbi:MAG TPA: cupredoxin domain-containing protein [Pseudolabrys sp.]|nr:cupredoxin domain-containing protein [Pseudolabrys sp.]
MWMTLAKMVLALALLASSAFLHADAQQPASHTVTVTVKNHRFQPAQIHAPANRPIQIRIKNLDPSRMEFESDTLHVEKVIGANGEGVVEIKPQAPGRYEFYDDFNQQSTGVLVVR